MVKVITCPIIGVLYYIFEEAPIENKPLKKNKTYRKIDWNYMFKGLELTKKRGNRFNS